MFGEYRQRSTRLLETAVATTSTIKVPTGVLKQDDHIAILSTNNDYRGAEEFIVSGITTTALVDTVTLDFPLQNDHFGSAALYPSDSTCDTRAEVIVLNSNVKIVGDSTQELGATFVVTDYRTKDGSTELKARGTVNIDSIEMENCSQEDTNKGCIRFETSTYEDSSYDSSYAAAVQAKRIKQVSNSALHGGLGIGLNIEDS